MNISSSKFIPMHELMHLLNKVKKNLANKNEVKTIEIIVNTIKTDFVERELNWKELDVNTNEDMINFAWEVLEKVGFTINNEFTNDDVTEWFEKFKNEKNNRIRKNNN